MENNQGVYWLRLVVRQPHRCIMEAEEGYKNCRRPGRAFRVMVGPHGPVCPGCVRVCRIPPALGLTRDDEIFMQKHPKPLRKASAPKGA